MDLKENRKNIVFILADDLGAWALGYAGNNEVQTPNLDKLAKESQIFTNFYCASPVCSPARASILTGQIPSRHGVLDWIDGGHVDKSYIDDKGVEDPFGFYARERNAIRYLEDQTTYTDLLAKNGYRVGLSGKWHLGDSRHQQHGFSHWYTVVRGSAFYMHPDVVENGEVKIEDEYVTDLFTDSAIQFIEEAALKKDQPFYLSVHYTAPHSPWEPENHKEEDLNIYRNLPLDSTPDVPDHPNSIPGINVYGTPNRRKNLEGYYAAITAMDRGIGKIIASLKEQGFYDDTIIIFTGDNGMNMGHHGVWGKGNATIPINMYDESIIVPCLFRVPEDENPGSKINNMYSQLDFFPTLMELVGISTDGLYLAGESFARLFDKGASRDGAETNGHGYIYMFDEYGPTRMIKNDRYKYIHRYPYGPHEFYDLLKDPNEDENLIDDENYNEIIDDLYIKLQSWYNEHMDPDKDGAKEAVTGEGQLTKIGKDSTSRKRFN